MPTQVASTIYLHIGTQKTGTTTLQTVGRENREALAARGILYPEAPGTTNHIGLTLYATGGLGNRDLMRDAGLRSPEDVASYQAALPGRLRSEILASGCSKVWLSNEHLSSRVRYVEQLKQLADMLRELAADVRVVIYLRHQPEYFLSTYSMMVKAGSNKETLPPQSEREYYYNYEKMLNVWAAAFGESAITVRVFERPVLKNGDVVDDFFAIMGIERGPDLVIPTGLNPSLDARVLQFLRLFRQHVPRYVDDVPNPDHGDVAKALEAISTGPKFRVPAVTMQRIATMFAPSNARVARRFLGREDGKLFAEMTYRDDEEITQLTTEQAVEIAAHLWVYKQRQIAELRTHRRMRHGGLAAGG
ncbi:MAG: hypothetical protein WDN04_20595 [Rhodospirillales bacterium]